jgi:hypothetical protein
MPFDPGLQPHISWNSASLYVGDDFESAFIHPKQKGRFHNLSCFRVSRILIAEKKFGHAEKFLRSNLAGRFARREDIDLAHHNVGKLRNFLPLLEKPGARLPFNHIAAIQERNEVRPIPKQIIQSSAAILAVLPIPQRPLVVLPVIVTHHQPSSPLFR